MRGILHTIQSRPIAGLFVGLILALAAAQSTHAITTISQGYITEGEVAVGSLVSLVDTRTDTVSAATVETNSNLLGVVVTGGSSLLSLGNGTSGEVQVATGGSAPVLVSDINGEIVQGDQITASPIAGVGMKATGNAKVIGVAQADMTKTTESDVEIDGNTRNLSLGNVLVLINVSYHYEQPEKTIIPAALQNIANALAGREVRPLPIIVSAIVFVIMLLVVASIVYAMIKNSIISVGRNPLAQSAVYRNVIQLAGVIVVIIAGSITIIYFILRSL